MKRARHCESEGQERKIAGYLIKQCPLRYADFGTNLFLEAYYHYKNGFLPNAGGWLNQPMKFSQMIILTDKLFAELQEEKDVRKHN